MIRNNDENALLKSNGIALLFNLILTAYTFDCILAKSLNLFFIIYLVLSYIAHSKLEISAVNGALWPRFGLGLRFVFPFSLIKD